MYFTPRQLSAANNVSVSSIYRFIKDEWLHADKLGCRYRITPEQWAAFIKDCNTRTVKEKVQVGGA